MKNTIEYKKVVNGVEFIAYKHWSYDGNVGIYLLDRVSKVGELVNDAFVKINFDEKQTKWLKETQSTDVLNIIL